MLLTNLCYLGYLLITTFLHVEHVKHNENNEIFCDKITKPDKWLN